MHGTYDKLALAVGVGCLVCVLTHFKYILEYPYLQWIFTVLSFFNAQIHRQQGRMEPVMTVSRQGNMDGMVCDLSVT